VKNTNYEAPYYEVFFSLLFHSHWNSSTYFKALYSLLCGRVNVGELNQILMEKQSVEKYEPRVQTRIFGSSSFSTIITNSDGVRSRNSQNNLHFVHSMIFLNKKESYLHLVCFMVSSFLCMPIHAAFNNKKFKFIVVNSY
jgi:hypothetical protein